MSQGRRRTPTLLKEDLLEPIKQEERRELLEMEANNYQAKSELQEINEIRRSRKTGCACKEGCLCKDNSCWCVAHGINCHAEGDGTFCSCDSWKCKNKYGRYEYNEESVYNTRRAKLRALERSGVLFLAPEEDSESVPTLCSPGLYLLHWA